MSGVWLIKGDCGSGSGREVKMMWFEYGIDTITGVIDPHRWGAV